MESDFAFYLMQEMIKAALLIASPIMGTCLFVGLLISIFQVVTQIQEMTLTFVPKILAVVFVLGALGTWMLSILINFSKELIGNIPLFLS